VSILIELLIYGALIGGVALAAHTAWDGFKDRIGAPYAAAQMAKDEPILEASKKAQAAAESDRDIARANSAKCDAALSDSNKAAAEWNAIAVRTANAAKAARAQADKDAAAALPMIADLQAKAAAKPQLMACQDELAKAKETLRASLRIGRPAPAAK
jgi:Tfp pilus assembly protein PilE